MAFRSVIIMDDERLRWPWLGPNPNEKGGRYLIFRNGVESSLKEKSITCSADRLRPVGCLEVAQLVAELYGGTI